MTIFKPSELPVGTTIIDETEGHYTKELDNAGNAFWSTLAVHCSDCADDYAVENDKADEFFKNFTISCVPWQVAWELALNLLDEYGSTSDLTWNEDKKEWEPVGPITIEGLIKDAMDETVEIQQEEWEQFQIEKAQRALEDQSDAIRWGRNDT